MFLRNRPADAATHPHGSVVACGAAPSLLEELAADPADFVDLACVVRIDLEALIATLVATQPETVEQLVARARELHGSAAGPVAEGATETRAASPIEAPADDPLHHVRALCAGVAERLASLASGSTSKDQRRTPSPWGGEERRGWGRWTRARGGARVHRDGADRPADPAVQATMVAP